MNELTKMSKLTFIRLCFWLYLVRTVVSKEDLYHKVGGELVLTPEKSTVPDFITSILWKHGKNKVAEWDKDFGSLDIYAAFKERTTLNQNTGELRISGLMKTDSGVYSVEFNSKLLDKTYTLSVIKAVPKPTITSSCNPDKTSCTLTCEGDTTDAEPVTYSWKVGERAWEVVDKQRNVSKSNTGKSNNGYKYICKLKNAVSEEISEPVGEVFGPEAVPKPTITSSCNPDKTSCTLTCEGDTTDAEPITYSWKVGERASEVVDKQMNVSKNDTGKSTNSYKYFCKMKNSAGEGEVSEPVELVFGSDGWLTKARLFGISVFVLAIAGVLSFILGHRAKTGVWIYEKESMPWKGEFWKHQREVGPTTDTSNGVSASTEEALARKNDHKDDSVL
ncbi:carcinoembryonic antigen-related cell adhesion molecule 5-like isoform X5 [Salvelinus fontinalis]|uniref:carcinoembryonic antigen-related cell adhesion molecule 5-like isoform X5 n=1 Tax=Salvelinus fontinalis TaxID=8038 RepID=UPI002485C6D2|nr:carcinoembryonic antigen-related cell adhesion molecule 5-like isoform X5 [Salvelinus fontinalis]